MSGITSPAKMPIPTSANAPFRLIANQFANPPNVPGRAPRLRSMKKYVPPERGIAVASSSFVSMLGAINSPARKYASTADAPVRANTMEGSTNKPELIIAPAAMQNTSRAPSRRLSMGFPCPFVTQMFSRLESLLPS